ncbi:hypothetical protein BJY00DRAFT_293765 [Aspergillus carlsbadensis]|nr:hypothetical protein BJY00DRAFT_293765 [Aspergillus carlsbadensis]
MSPPSSERVHGVGGVGDPGLWPTVERAISAGAWRQSWLREGGFFLSIDAELRAIASLESIAARVTSGSVAASVRDFLQVLGWAVY